MNKDFFKSLSEQEILAAYEGNELWRSEDILREDNPISKLCDKYELETNSDVDAMELAEAVLYEMAHRFYSLKIHSK
ncbi:hypothetical protein BSK66_26600 [Paenibacillus odorifer]|uniref:hypothetical protein n=1 Tax=Paenibacillus TaxID=44249 RepID=UPI0003E267B6|nr:MULTISPECIES: hypothetical protein [Paenibacillus]ETT49318.1 hypothetical protein C171_23635 [Paenibacillus sp. FSL H8-237]OME49530.1 hypothetical protein BSK66_26600 [Paenibacillus odorifer]